MRTIKFRGKDTATGRWVYGDLVHNQGVTEQGLKPRVMVGGYEVEEHTVGQFTGITDKHGKEIYEGDVLRIYEKERDFDGGYRYRALKGYHKVFWSEDALAFRIKDDEGFCQDFELNYEKYEVVGDIYDERFEDWK